MSSIEAALTTITSQEAPNYAAVAKKYGYDKNTLSRRHRGITSLKIDTRNSKNLLSIQQQKDLINYINKFTTRGLPPTQIIIANFA